MEKFQIVVNAFTREVLIAKNYPTKREVKLLSFEDLDEWKHVEFSSETINFHFFYEEELDISLYQVDLVEFSEEVGAEYLTNYDTPLPYELRVVTKENEFAIYFPTDFG